jgi:hypothetical protein
MVCGGSAFVNLHDDVMSCVGDIAPKQRKDNVFSPNNSSIPVLGLGKRSLGIFCLYSALIKLFAAV